ncbi:MAG: universal stress protein [Pseudomonadota bacterium]
MTRTAIRRILVVVDPTATTHPCIQKAMRIARATASTVELYVCEAELNLPESWAGESRLTEYWQITRQRQLEELNRLAAPLRAAGIEVETVCERHPPLEEGIGRHIVHSRPDLVVKDAHSHPVQSRNYSGHTDWTLVRQSPAPVLLVQSQQWREAPPIVLAIDPAHPVGYPGKLDEAIVCMGLAMQGALGADMQLLHVLGAPPHLPGEIVTDEVLMQVQDRLRMEVSDLALRAGMPASMAQFGSGNPAHGIVEFVNEQKPSLLVMGSRARFAQAFAAGTALQVLQQVECDLLVVKPPGFIRPLLVTEE